MPTINNNVMNEYELIYNTIDYCDTKSQLNSLYRLYCSYIYEGSTRNFSLLALGAATLGLAGVAVPFYKKLKQHVFSPIWHSKIMLKMRRKYNTIANKFTNWRVNRFTKGQQKHQEWMNANPYVQNEVTKADRKNNNKYITHFIMNNNYNNELSRANATLNKRNAKIENINSELASKEGQYNEQGYQQ